MTHFEYMEIISMAIRNEIAAYEFYKAVSEKVGDHNLGDIFREMAEEEKKHRIILEGFASGQKPLKFSEVADYKVSESVDKPKLSLAMKPADAIALAMKEEEEAMHMYQGLAGSSTSAEQRDMFLALAKMEKGHKARLEDMYTGVAFPEVW